jgi:diguanylate cyclase (GGDEF)-like protein
MNGLTKQRIKRVSRTLLGFYGGVLIAFCATCAATLYLAWLWDLEVEKKELLRHARSASVLIQASLTDGSKILDAARLSIEKRFMEGNLGREEPYHIIRKVMEEFSIYNSPDTLGLLLYLDRDGKLVAQSGVSPSPAYDLSNRSYYLDLKKDPSSKFSLGKLRVTATTGKRAFHLAMPVHGANEEFEGLVTIQLQEADLVAILQKMLEGVDDTILVQLPCGDTALIFPPMPTLQSDDPVSGLLGRLIQQHGGTEGWFRIPATNPGSDGMTESTWVAYVRDPTFGLTSSARMSEHLMLKHSIRKRCYLLGIFLLSLVIISGLFFALFRKTLGLEKFALDASFDHMTKIRNRRSLERGLSRLWRDAMRSAQPITLLFMDIDRFKDFNDTHGHQAGDRVLKGVARIIHRSMQRPLDLCGRWGGEEFLAALPETTAKEALHVAERIRRRVALMNLKINGDPLPKISISIGIAGFPDHGSVKTLEELIKKADTALHRAKKTGRNRTVIYCPGEDGGLNAPLLPGIADQDV